MKIEMSLIQELYDILSPKAIFLVGSSPIINKPNDVDLSLIYDHRRDYVAIRKKISKEQNVRVHEIVVNNNISLLPTGIDDLYNGFTADFMYEADKYMIYLVGDETCIDKDKINVFKNNIFKDKVLVSLYTDLDIHFGGAPKHNIYGQKPYRLLWSCYILYNKSYDITDEQKRILNEVHDSKQMSEDLWQWCLGVVSHASDDLCAKRKKEESTNDNS